MRRRKGTVMGGAAKHVLTGPRLRWRQMASVVWRALWKTPCVTEGWRRYGVETCGCRDGENAEASGPGEGAGMNGK
jgi:hypothetical protein